MNLRTWIAPRSTNLCACVHRRRLVSPSTSWLFATNSGARLKISSPDVFILDPFNRLARDDKAKDYAQAFEDLLAVLPNGDDAPALGIVAHTRKPRADERANGRALLNLLAGSYVIGSVPRTVFIMQAASDDTTDNRSCLDVLQKQ